MWNVWENVDSTCWETDSYIISAYNADVWSVWENEMNISQVPFNKCLSECHLWRLLWCSCDLEPQFWSEQSTLSIGRAIAIKRLRWKAQHYTCDTAVAYRLRWPARCETAVSYRLRWLTRCDTAVSYRLRWPARCDPNHQWAAGP